MRVARIASLLAIFGLSACSSSNNNPTNKDGSTTDAPKGDTATDMAPTDTPAGDVNNDGGNGDVVPGSVTQKLALTVIVTDQIGGDGGLEVGPAADGGADAADAATITVDPNLVNPWGLAINPTGPLWVADNHAGVSTIYTATGQPTGPMIVTVPVPDGGTPPSAPTGLAFNAVAANFLGDKFIFASEDGTISGWQTGTAATLRVDNSTTNAVYKGLTLATVGGVSHLIATDFHNGKVDVFDSAYAKFTTTGGFADATIPAGYAPFGVQVAGAAIYVTYAKQDDMKMDDSAGAGHGYVNLFDFEGRLTKRFVSQGALDSPWGVAVAPADFGAFSNAVLIGNFGDGHINAYAAGSGVLLGAALNTTGAPLVIEGLWSIAFAGNDTAGVPHNRLFFTSGPHMENHGVLGHLDLP
jgi:uncharacterized protein (TIGR03118 family)